MSETPMAYNSSNGQMRAARMLSPIFERLPFVLGTSLTIAIVAGAIAFLQPQKFQAALALSTINSSSRGSGLAASLPAALLAGATQGLQPTPALLSTLASSRNVVAQVAAGPVPGRPGATVITALEGEEASNWSDDKTYKKVRKVFGIGSDRETGLVTISIAHRDSALARFVATQFVGAITAAFRTAARAQAVEQRVSLHARLDSAAERLRRAETASREFAGANRVVAPYSVASVEAGRLERELRIAESVYNQVVTESEAAKGRELEDTPAVVVVDPIPRQLVPMSKRSGTIALGTAVLMFVLLTMWVTIADQLRLGESSPAEERARLEAALRRLVGNRLAGVTSARPR